VNPAETYGPDDTDLVTAGNLIDFAKGAVAFVCRGGASLAHVDDVAAGIVAALERGRSGERYILGGENLTHRELAGLFLELAGLHKTVLSVPNPVVRSLARLAPALGLPLPFDPNVIPYATRYWFVDSGKAETELGVRFRSARATLQPTVEWLQKAGHMQ
jgi:dihydroflavonol-4-reductase